MTTELEELYQEVILDHSKHPRNYRPLPDADHKAEGYNPICGDRIVVFVNVSNDHVQDISFQGSACAICTASASMMTHTLKGKPRHEAMDLFTGFHKLLTSGSNTESPGPQLGQLAALAGVRRFPVRVKCATLPWHTMRAAIQKDAESVTTE